MIIMIKALAGNSHFYLLNHQANKVKELIYKSVKYISYLIGYRKRNLIIGCFQSVSRNHTFRSKKIINC